MGNMESNLLALSTDNIKNRIYTIRGMQVMLDADLAKLYNVETKQFNRAVKRNIERFPYNFCICLAKVCPDDKKFVFIYYFSLKYSDF